LKFLIYTKNLFKNGGQYQYFLRTGSTKTMWVFGTDQAKQFDTKEDAFRIMSELSSKQKLFIGNILAEHTIEELEEK